MRKLSVAWASLLITAGCLMFYLHYDFTLALPFVFGLERAIGVSPFLSAQSPINYNQVLGAGFVVISPNGPNDGGNYGPATTNTNSNGFKEGFTAAGSILKTIIYGSYNINTQTTIPSGADVEFVNATLTITSPGINCFSATLASDITFRGNPVFDGGKTSGGNGNGYVLNACGTILFDWDCQARNFSSSPVRQLILCNASGTNAGSSLTFRGQTTTSDSSIIRVTDWSQVDISGVMTNSGGMTSKPSNQHLIAVFSDGVAATIRQINIHDCELDAGGLMAASGVVFVQGSASSNIDGVQLNNLQVRNVEPVPGTGLFDGIDVSLCVNVTITNIVGDTCFDLLSVQATRASISNVVGTNCNGTAVSIGDTGVQQQSYSDITVTGCIATNCGQLTTNLNGSGFVTGSSTGFTLDRVSWTDCRSRDTASVQNYGMLVQANGTTTNVQIIGGEMNGVIAPLRSIGALGLNLNVLGVMGVNDLGVLATPFDNNNNTIGTLVNTAHTPVATPTANKVYTVGPTKLHIEAQHASVTVTWKDSLGGIKVSALGIATQRGFDPEVGDTFAFSGNPTVLTVATR